MRLGLSVIIVCWICLGILAWHNTKSRVENGIKAANQPVSQPSSQLARKSGSQPANQPASQAARQPVRQPGKPASQAVSSAAAGPLSWKCSRYLYETPVTPQKKSYAPKKNPRWHVCSAASRPASRSGSSAACQQVSTSRATSQPASHPADLLASASQTASHPATALQFCT
jgi:hypothetical protein